MSSLAQVTSIAEAPVAYAARTLADVRDILLRGPDADSQQVKLQLSGQYSRLPIDSKPIEIPPDRWRVLKPDFDKSEACGVGLTMTGILVFEAPPEPLPKPPPVPRAVSQAKRENWYHNWIDENRRRGTIPSRDEDWAAAKREFGEAVTREAVRDLRRRLAPSDWRDQGRRKSANKTGG